MIVIAGTLRIPTDKLQEALPHFEKVITASRAEPGCMLYSFSYDALEPGLIRVFEIYRDQAAVESHRASAHFQAWRASNPGLGVGDRDITVYQVSSAQKA